MKIAVLGSGNGAHAVAFECARAGHEVSMFDFPRFSASVEAIAAAGGISSVGRMEGFQKIAYAGTDIAAVMEGASLIIAVGPSYSTEPFAEACRPYVREGQVYVVMPGSCMGALVFKRALRLDSLDERVCVAETSTLPYAVRIMGPASIDVYHRLIGAYTVATLPRSKGDEVYELLTGIFTGMEKGRSVFETTLSNSNPVIHPVVTTLNVGLIERTRGDFEFYSEGITPSVGNLMEAIDTERLRIGEALGVKLERGPSKGIRQGYANVDTNDYCLSYSTAPGFAGIRAQSSLDHRYYNEDLGYTMMFWLDLADRFGVDVPGMQSLVTLASMITKKDFRKDPPRTLASLGLDGWTREQLLEL